MARCKKWNIGDRAAFTAAAEIARELELKLPTALLLCSRGCKNSNEALDFIRLEQTSLHNPFLMPDMKEACDRILAALDKNEKITVYGDYDVDGVTSTSLLCLYLGSLGASVDFYIPNRIGEGYGVSCEAIKKLTEDGTTLIITVDTGITATAEVEYARGLGCDVIVTDHHECHEALPKALAVVNPKRPDSRYPFKEMAGVGVAFKLATALEFSRREGLGLSTDGLLQDICSRYIDLAALGTIADVMPLSDENRLIVSMGLKLMESSPRHGIRALIEASDGGKSRANRKITSSLVGFTLAPRINAAGRITTADRAVRLFLTSSEQEAASIAEELCETNRRRQAEENKIISQIDELIASNPGIVKDPVIVLSDNDWHHGVIGIVASRITEKYGKPSILISFEGDVGKGSGRSIEGLNLVGALSSCSELLVKFGGHELAAGLTVNRENLPALKAGLCEYAEKHIDVSAARASLDIDFELYPSEVSLALASELDLLEPYGVSNPVPVFLMRELEISGLSSIGQGKHTKLTLSGQGKRFTAVYFGISPERLGCGDGDTVDAVFNISINEFMGHRTEQLIIRDMRFSDELEALCKCNVSCYKALLKNGGAGKEHLPVRDDFVAVYLRLKRILVTGDGDVNVNLLLKELYCLPSGGEMNYVKLRLVLDILAESGIIEMLPLDEECLGAELFYIKLSEVKNKVNLEKSCLYKRLMT